MGPTNITESDIGDLALGAVVLGAGGGGDPHVTKLMVAESIEKRGPVSLAPSDELDPDGLVLPVAMVGAPAAVVEKIPNGGEAGRVSQTLQRRLDREAVAVMPIEVGGMNALFPLAVAGELGLPCVDADAMGRSFPQLEMTLFAVAGISASPIALSDAHGNDVMFDTHDNGLGERLVRNCVAQLGMIAVVCAYPVTVEQCRRHAADGSVSRCMQIGRRLRAVRDGGPDAYPEFLRYCDAQVLFSGRVVDVEWYTSSGWARGTVTLEHVGDRRRVMRVETQNENLIAFEDGEARVTVPDLITLLDVETAVPMSTESLAYGQRLDVIAMPAHERWHTAAGLALTGPRAFGYDMDFVPLVGAR